VNISEVVGPTRERHNFNGILMAAVSCIVFEI